MLSSQIFLFSPWLVLRLLFSQSSLLGLFPPRFTLVYFLFYFLYEFILSPEVCLEFGTCAVQKIKMSRKAQKSLRFVCYNDLPSLEHSKVGMIGYQKVSFIPQWLPCRLVLVEQKSCDGFLKVMLVFAGECCRCV